MFLLLTLNMQLPAGLEPLQKFEKAVEQFLGEFNVFLLPTNRNIYSIIVLANGLKNK